jgi:osmotically-inducible protein OsmY
MSRNAYLSPLSATLSLREVETLARSFEVEGLRLTRTAGVLVMEGRVPCYSVKTLAGKTAARLFGAARVVNRLRVVPQSHRGDKELADAVRAGLRLRPGLTDTSIVVSASHGIVTLRGSVACPDGRCEAESATWAVGGVVDVDNQLLVERLLAGNGHAGGRTSLPDARR